MAPLFAQCRRLRPHQSDILRAIEEQGDPMLLGSGQAALLLEARKCAEPPGSRLWQGAPRRLPETLIVELSSLANISAAGCPINRRISACV
jgi:hypothetical protein